MEEGGGILTVFFHLSFNFRSIRVCHLWKIPVSFKISIGCMCVCQRGHGTRKVLSKQYDPRQPKNTCPRGCGALGGGHTLISPSHLYKMGGRITPAVQACCKDHQRRARV